MWNLLICVSSNSFSFELKAYVDFAYQHIFRILLLYLESFNILVNYHYLNKIMVDNNSWFFRGVLEVCFQKLVRNYC